MKVATTLLPNPFEKVVWWGLDAPITKEEVREAIDEGRLCHESVVSDFSCRPSRGEHVERVAYFVVNGWEAAIDVEYCFGNWPVQDGNHRLAAAYFLGLPEVEASFSGFLSDIQERFGGEFAAEVEKEWLASEE